MRSSRKECGQVLTEYVLMLVVAVLLGMGLLVLCRSISDKGNENIEFISGDVP